MVSHFSVDFNVFINIVLCDASNTVQFANVHYYPLFIVGLLSTINIDS